MSVNQRSAFTDVLRATGMTEFHHGDCVGADAQAHEIVADLFPDVDIHIHPPTKDDYRANCFQRTQQLSLERSLKIFQHPTRPYLDRNRDIVDSSDLVLAAPNTYGEVLRSGTWATVRYAWKINTPIIIVNPDGSLRVSAIISIKELI